MREFLFSMALLASACTNRSSSGPSDGGPSGGSTPSATGDTSAPGSTSGSSGSGGGGGSTGSTGETGAASTGCARYAFCEDFESGSPGETPPGWADYWGWDPGGSRAVLSSEEAHGGAQSLAGAIGTNGQYRVVHALDALGDLAGHHWGRIFYKVRTPVALDGQYVHNTFVAFGRPQADNGSESRVVDTVVDPYGKHQFLFNVPDDSCCAGSSYDYQYEGGWHCAEWYVEAATESFRFFYDGNEVTDLAFTGVDGAHIADFDSVIVGWIDYQSPSTPNVGWFDDLALDDERIGCD